MEKFVVVPRAEMTESVWSRPFSELVTMAEAGMLGMSALELEGVGAFASRAGEAPLSYQQLVNTPELGNHMQRIVLRDVAVLRGDRRTDKAYLLGQGW